MIYIEKKEEMDKLLKGNCYLLCNDVPYEGNKIQCEESGEVFLIESEKHDSINMWAYSLVKSWKTQIVISKDASVYINDENTLTYHNFYLSKIKILEQIIKSKAIDLTLIEYKKEK